MGLGPAAFLLRSKTSLAAVNRHLDYMEAASVITTTDISKGYTDKPIMIHGRDETVALYDLMTCFYHYLFGSACPFVHTLLYTKKVVE